MSKTNIKEDQKKLNKKKEDFYSQRTDMIQINNICTSYQKEMFLMQTQITTRTRKEFDKSQFNGKQNMNFSKKKKNS